MNFTDPSRVRRRAEPASSHFRRSLRQGLAGSASRALKGRDTKDDWSKTESISVNLSSQTVFEAREARLLCNWSKRGVGGTKGA